MVFIAIKKSKRTSSSHKSNISYVLESRNKDIPNHSQNIQKNENCIFSTLHPFEESGICGLLSPVQKAITYVMKINNGWATEQEILSFLKSNWTLITSHTSHRYRQGPDKRMLHINFSITKENKQLFIPHPTIPNKWGLPSSIKNSNTPKLFRQIQSNSDLDTNLLENYIRSSFLNNPMGLAFQEILKEQESHKDAPGLFSSLPYERRIRAILIVLKAEGEIKNENLLWIPVLKPRSFKSETSKELSHPTKKHSISALSTNELYEMFAKKGHIL